MTSMKILLYGLVLPKSGKGHVIIVMVARVFDNVLLYFVWVKLKVRLHFHIIHLRKFIPSCIFPSVLYWGQCSTLGKNKSLLLTSFELVLLPSLLRNSRRDYTITVMVKKCCLLYHLLPLPSLPGICCY